MAMDKLHSCGHYLYFSCIEKSLYHETGRAQHHELFFMVFLSLGEDLQLSVLQVKKHLHVHLLR